MGAAKADKKAAVTLQTIADRLGVSRTTVSNAFSKPDQLTPELRGRILAEAKELDYCGPDPVAKSLRSGKSGAIGLLLNETLSYVVTDPAAVLMMQGIAEVFDDREASMLVLPARLDRSSGIGAVRDALVDGFLIQWLTSDDPRIAVAMGRNLPVVTMDQPRLDGAGYVGIDDRGGAMSAAQHLIELGHRSIAILGFPLIEDEWSGFVPSERIDVATIHVSKERMGGYRAALEEGGVPWRSVTAWETSINSIENGKFGAGRLLDRAERPTAILCTSDQLAIGVIQAAQERGLRVPQDVSVVGFDDIPGACQVQPALTTVRQPLRQKGAVSARMLLDGWSGAPPQIVLPTELIVRASTGPAPGR